MEQIANEVKYLQRRVVDLVSPLSLPGPWNAHDPFQIMTVVLDLPRRMPRLDFAYSQLHHAMKGRPIEVVRLGRCRYRSAQLHDDQSTSGITVGGAQSWPRYDISIQFAQ